MNSGTHNSQGESIHWATPQVVLDPVREFFGGTIDLDPCSNDKSIVGAEVEFLLPKNDGLRDLWDVKGRGTSVYVNSPFGRCFLRDDRLEVLSAKEWTAGRRLWEEFDKRGIFFNDGEHTVGPENQLVISPEYAARFTSTSIADWVRVAGSAHHTLGCEVIMLLPAAIDTAHWQSGIFAHATAMVAIKGRLKFLGNVTGPAPMATALVYWGKSPEAFQDTCGRLGRYLRLSPR